jgi:tetratricopeptide (TPR) repeat protein
MDRLVSELLPAEGDSRPLGEYLYERMLQLRVLRGDVAAVRTDLAALSAWAETDDPELREAYAVAKGIASAVIEGPAAAVETLLPVTRAALANAGTDENLRYAWAVTVDALLGLGRIDEAAELVEVAAARPPGHTSPYLRAQIQRAQAMIAAARDDHEAAEASFRAAVGALRALDYRYWLARAQTDYAAWLLDQARHEEAAPLLEEAVGVLENLGAEPALQRARALLDAAPVAVPD